ncbi:hypothetical protein H9P43_001908 [Blastocladiella emersonii ATCC 22665]|nr:hypothetical protein H9P43_001908 [Blastocladiella emersonii ATCC 22665]
MLASSSSPPVDNGSLPAPAPGLARAISLRVVPSTPTAPAPGLLRHRSLRDSLCVPHSLSHQQQLHPLPPPLPAAEPSLSAGPSPLSSPALYPTTSDDGHASLPSSPLPPPLEHLSNNDTPPAEKPSSGKHRFRRVLDAVMSSSKRRSGSTPRPASGAAAGASTSLGHATLTRAQYPQQQQQQYEYRHSSHDEHGARSWSAPESSHAYGHSHHHADEYAHQHHAQSQQQQYYQYEDHSASAAALGTTPPLYDQQQAYSYEEQGHAYHHRHHHQHQAEEYQQQQQQQQYYSDHYDASSGSHDAPSYGSLHRQQPSYHQQYDGYAAAEPVRPPSRPSSRHRMRENGGTIGRSSSGYDAAAAGQYLTESHGHTDSGSHYTSAATSVEQSPVSHLLHGAAAASRPLSTPDPLPPAYPPLSSAPSPAVARRSLTTPIHTVGLPAAEPDSTTTSPSMLTKLPKRRASLRSTSRPARMGLRHSGSGSLDSVGAPDQPDSPAAPEDVSPSQRAIPQPLANGGAVRSPAVGPSPEVPTFVELSLIDAMDGMGLGIASPSISPRSPSLSQQSSPATSSTAAQHPLATVADYPPPPPLWSQPAPLQTTAVLPPAPSPLAPLKSTLRRSASRAAASVPPPYDASNAPSLPEPTTGSPSIRMRRPSAADLHLAPAKPLQHHHRSSAASMAAPESIMVLSPTVPDSPSAHSPVVADHPRHSTSGAPFPSGLSMNVAGLPGAPPPPTVSPHTSPMRSRSLRRAPVPVPQSDADLPPIPRRSSSRERLPRPADVVRGASPHQHRRTTPPPQPAAAVLSASSPSPPAPAATAVSRSLTSTLSTQAVHDYYDGTYGWLHSSLHRGVQQALPHGRDAFLAAVGRPAPHPRAALAALIGRVATVARDSIWRVLDDDPRLVARAWNAAVERTVTGDPAAVIAAALIAATPDAVAQWGKDPTRAPLPAPPAPREGGLAEADAAALVQRFLTAIATALAPAANQVARLFQQYVPSPPPQLLDGGSAPLALAPPPWAVVARLAATHLVVSGTRAMDYDAPGARASFDIARHDAGFSLDDGAAGVVVLVAFPGIRWRPQNGNGTVYRAKVWCDAC